ncbi:hypothetical protein O181_133930 [Austropuccinia psidii MF-1]|uniref:Uncharacterized protein n=1 Tax=Austropuccinia psidii MF-1 TaxID=1389203 RepID=A0A9Q3QDU6_9BASI|nr:hypothetical protein [Austropuccinia psidii MF-1]
MENKDIIKQNLNKSKIEIRKSEQELEKELTQEPKEESDTYLPKENNLFHIHTSNKDPTFPEYSQHLKNFNPRRELNKEIQLVKEAIKQVVTVEKGSEITKNEDPINLKTQYFTNTRNPMEQYLMENKSEPNERYKSNSINHSTSAKEEDSPTPHYHSDKDNPNLNLGINYLSLDKAKEIQINKNEEINEDISNRQQKQDQEALLKKQILKNLKQMEFYLQKTNFPGKAIPIGSL